MIRRKEISDFMTANLWVAEYKPNMNAWYMMKEPYAYSQGPFEVIAVGKTLEDAFDKAKEQHGGSEKVVQSVVDDPH